MKLDKLLIHIWKERKIQVCVEPLLHVFNDVSPLLLSRQLMYHVAPFCCFCKQHASKSCNRAKTASIKKAYRGRTFAGTCPFGVWEAVYPVFFNDIPVAILYLGNFTTPEGLKRHVNGHLYSGPEFPLITDAVKAEMDGLADFLRKYIIFELKLLKDEGRFDTISINNETYFQRVKNYIDLHYSSELSLKDIARHCGVNHDYLGKIIKAQSGKSFRQLLTERRLAEAKLLLESSGKSVSEIAHLCGYPDSNYFSAVFHRANSLSPNKFRENYFTYVHTQPIVHRLKKR